MPQIHTGKVRKGKFIPDDRIQFIKEFAKKDDTRLEVTVRKPRKYRSLQQNKYYWGVVISLLSETTGFSKDEMHDALRVKFLTDLELIGEKTTLPRIQSTTELSTVEFLEYVSQIQQWAAEFLDCYIPDPESWEE